MASLKTTGTFQDTSRHRIATEQEISTIQVGDWVDVVSTEQNSVIGLTCFRIESAKGLVFLRSRLFPEESVMGFDKNGRGFSVKGGAHDAASFFIGVEEGKGVRRQ